MPSPPPFLSVSGEPPLPFETWQKIFQNYLIVIQATGDAWPEARRRAVLLHCLGTEGQRLFYTLPDTGTTFDEAMTALQKHFVPKVNVVACRHTFRQRVQRADETITQYMAALRALAAPCAFGQMESEMLRDQLIANVSLTAVKDKLLLEEDLTLEKAITIACQVEAAVKNSSLLSHSTATAMKSVQAISMDTKYGRRGKSARSTKQSLSAQSRSEDRKQTATCQQRRQCFRCGSDKHLANDKNCPAAKVTCRLCGKKGHFARVCKTASEVREVVVPDVTVLCVDNIQQSAAANDKITCEVNIEAPGGNKHMLQLVVDTGASVSILPEAVYKKHFSQCTLNKPKIKLVTYAKEDLPVIGCLSALASVSANDNVVPATFYVVTAGSPLLGLDLIRLLNLDIVSGKVKHIDHEGEIAPAPLQTTEHSTSAVHAVSPVSATHLGCVKGFIHKVQVNSTVTPVRQKLRRLPLSIRKEVSTELNRLLTAGIIESIDASEWVSPLVVVRKRDGNIRLCVDLREPNKSVIMDCYPLPHMEDLFTELAGASHYSQIDLSSAYHQLPLHQSYHSPLQS